MKEIADRTRQAAVNEDWIALARSLMPRSQRHAVGSGLVDMLRTIEMAKYKGHELHYSTPWAATLAGGFSRRIWMLDKPFRKIPRGTVVTLVSKAKWLEEAGAELVEVRYPKDRALYRALKSKASSMRGVRRPEQFGVATRKDAYARARKHSKAKVAMLARLSDDSVDMTSHEVMEVFSKVFLVNKDEASKLSALCTYQGRLYRGCPLARQLLGIRTLECVRRLSSLCDSVGADFTDYGGEFLITHESWEYFSAGFKKTVVRIVHECGLELATDGFGCMRISPRGTEPGAITGLTVDFDVLGWPYVRPLKRARQLRHIG